MKKKKVKSEPGEKAVRAVDSSRLTSHVSRSSITFFNHVSRSFSHSFIHILCLAFLIIIIYSNTLNAPFQWDESDFIVNNPIIKNLHYFTSPSDAKELPLYIALVNRYIGYLTFALNYRINGLSVTGYHIVNISIHIANSVLVYLFVLLTFRTPFFKGQGSRVRGQELKAGSQSLERGSQSLAPCPLPLVPKFVAFFSAAIFAVHPLQTEAVTYVFQRFASLVTFFYLLSLVFYIKARLIASSETDSGQAGIGSQFTFHGSRFTFFLISFLSAVLAMKTKENAFTLPFVIALYEFCFFNSSSLLPLDKGRMGGVTRRLLYLAPILLTLLIIPLTLMSLTGAHQLDPGTYGARQFSRWDYFYTQFRVIVTYLRLLFLPVNQNISYDYPVFKSFFNPPVLLSFVALAALFGLGVYLIKIGSGQKKVTPPNLPLDKGRKIYLFPPLKIRGGEGELRFTSHVSRPFSDSRPFRLMGFGILWFFITLSVESSIIPIPMLINEYRIYLPSVGMIICIVTGAFLVFSPKVGALEARLTKSRCFGSTSHVSRPLVSRLLIVLLVLIAGVLAVATYQRNELWGDKISLWEDTVRKSSANALVHYNLGTHYQENNMPDKAIEQYLIAVRLNPDYAEAYNNLGNIYKDNNMPDKAIEQYLIAVRLKPDYADAHYNLGVIYQSLKMFDRAIEHYLIVTKLKPESVEARNNLGFTYQTLNMPDKAVEQYLVAVKLKPDSAVVHNNLGSIYQVLNMPDKAVGELQTVVALKPNVAGAHFNLGLAYYKLGQMDKARQELTAGLKIRPDNQEAQQLLKTVTKECKR